MVATRETFIADYYGQKNHENEDPELLVAHNRVFVDALQGIDIMDSQILFHNIEKQTERDAADLIENVSMKAAGIQLGEETHTLLPETTITLKVVVTTREKERIIDALDNAIRENLVKAGLYVDTTQPIPPPLQEGHGSWG